MAGVSYAPLSSASLVIIIIIIIIIIITKESRNTRVKMNKNSAR